MRERIRHLAFVLACKRFHGANLVQSPNAWYSSRNPLVWAYGGGGRKYGNAAEDIDRSIAEGFKVIELDFARCSDGVPVASHFFMPENNPTEWNHIPTSTEFKARLVNGEYTPLTFRDVIARYANSNVFFSLDPFYYHCKVKNGEQEFRNYVIGNTIREEREKLILQIYSFKALCAMRGNKQFGALHYVIGVDNWWKVKHLIPVLTEVGVHSVSFQDCAITNEIIDGIKRLHNAGIVVSAAGVDNLERYKELISLGVDCINTTYLRPKELRA